MPGEYGFSKIFKEKIAEQEKVEEEKKVETVKMSEGKDVARHDLNPVPTKIELVSKCHIAVMKDNEPTKDGHWFVCTECNNRCELIQIHDGNRKNYEETKKTIKEA